VIEGGGGVNNGSTRYDYTNYIASAPVSALDAVLWLEADRMKTLDFSEKNLKNQQEVVKEEIRVNVKNRPYGLFFWTDLAGKAFDKWENAHDGYGSFEDLDAANIGTSRASSRILARTTRDRHRGRRPRRGVREGGEVLRRAAGAAAAAARGPHRGHELGRALARADRRARARAGGGGRLQGADEDRQGLRGSRRARRRPAERRRLAAYQRS
jgi:hypothetical protein